MNPAIPRKARSPGVGAPSDNLAMQCPSCQAETEVIETRIASSGGVRRRRRCTACVVAASKQPYTFATIELLRDEVDAMREAKRSLDAIVALLRSAAEPAQTRPADLDLPT